jgi:hypothetical protein
VDIEIKMLRPNINFDNLYSFDHGKNTIFMFDQVRIRPDNKLVKTLNGTWMVVILAQDYFHTLKESVGSYLYYKKHIDKDINILLIDLNSNEIPFHKARKVTQELFMLLAKDNKNLFYINADEFYSRGMLIERLALIYDGNKSIVNDSFPYFKQEKNANNKVVRDFLKDYMIEDLDKPKKIFISRRLVSEVLEKENKLDSISRYNPKWVEDAIEDFFKKHGYTILELSGMSLDDQIGYFYNADYVAGQIGNGSINGIFCKPGTNFIFLKTHSWFHYPYHEDIDQVIKANYKIVELYNNINYDQIINSLYLKLNNVDF